MPRRLARRPPPGAILPLLLLAGACTPGPDAPPPATPSAPAASAAAEAAPTAPLPPPAPIVAGAMPGDVQLYAELTDVPGLLAAEKSLVGVEAVSKLHAEVAADLGIDPRLEERLVAAVASAHVGGRKAGDDLEGGLALVLADPQPARDLVTSGAFVDAEPYGPYGRRLEKAGVARKARTEERIVWFDAPKLLVIADDPMARGIAAVVEGRAPGLSDAQRAAAPPMPRRQAWGFVAPALLDEIGKGHVSFPAPLSITYGLTDGGLRGAYRAAIAARDLPPGLPAPPPRALALARRLPAETIGYLALSTGIPGGHAGAQWITTQLEALAGREARGLDEAMVEVAGLHLADAIGALGGEGVAGVVVRPGVQQEAALDKSFALVVLQEIAEPGPAEALLKAARDRLASLHKKAKVHAEGTGFSAELLADAPVPYVRARLSGGRLFFGLGQRDLVERAALAADKGKGTLGEDAAHARAVSTLPPNAGLRLWIDLGRVAQIAAASVPPDQRPFFDVIARSPGGPGRLTSALSFSAVPESDRIRLDLDELNGLGVFAAVGIYGVRRYLASAKVAEAKSTIGALTRAAVAAYERERLGAGGSPIHALCTSAPPVPAEVPHGRMYQPSTAAGSDFETGDDEHGWRCLKFAMIQPVRYRYTYTMGGPYKGPARGGPDPGPDGFEVSAEGDLDGNGVTSLFTRIGRVRNGQIVVSTELFVDKEYE